MSHATRVNESCHTCAWVMSHMWMCHVTRMNEWIIPQMWMSHTSHTKRVDKSCPTWHPVVPHVWRLNDVLMNHVPRFVERSIERLIGTCPTWQRVMPHVWIRWSHTFIKRFLDTCRWIVSHIFVGVSLWMRHVKQLWHNSSTRVAWHTYQRVMPHVWIRSSHKYGWTAPDGSCQMQEKVAFAELLPNMSHMWMNDTCDWRNRTLVRVQ